jgi:hypothetical protein
MPQHTGRHPPLLPEHAFVVQLYAGTQVAAGQVAGRIEHLVSRQATTFASLEALLAFMARILQEVHHADNCPG